MLRRTLARRLAWLVVSLASQLAACSGDVVTDHDAGSTGAGGGGGGGAGGGSSTTGGGSCSLEGGSVGLYLSTYKGEVFGCAGGPGFDVGDTSLEGVIVAKGGGEYELDSCPPSANCVPLISRLSLTVSGAEIEPIPSGAFVKMDVHVEGTMSCSPQIAIWNLPTWDGEKNPVWDKFHPWIVASEGLPSAPPSAPFTVEKGDVVCEGSAEQPAAKVYELVFTFPLGGPESYPSNTSNSYKSEMDVVRSVMNLRSFEAGVPDSYWDWAWVVQHLPAQE